MMNLRAQCTIPWPVCPACPAGGRLMSSGGRTWCDFCGTETNGNNEECRLPAVALILDNTRSAALCAGHLATAQRQIGNDVQELVVTMLNGPDAQPEYDDFMLGRDLPDNHISTNNRWVSTPWLHQ